MRIGDFVKYKSEGRKISMVSAYDTLMARLISDSPIDCILVGDSVAMARYGFETTIHATLEMMERHTAAVCRGAAGTFVVADLPFLSFRKGLQPLMDAVERLMQAGASAVKLEGAKGNLENISHVVDSGIPVMGHIGLTPQSFHQMGGFKVQDGAHLLEEARSLQEAGAFAVVLECMPHPLAKDITNQLRVPSIGIGAGPDVDGQVLVLDDILGFNSHFAARFVRRYGRGDQMVKEALSSYHKDVTAGAFPTRKEAYP